MRQTAKPYLLVFDRRLAEEIVSEHYPSEGPHYLERISRPDSRKRAEPI